ncbi:membrane protein TerC, possibly involved in tellurium resistance [Candidatus Nitrososphaera evergladensis SR1]|uniref:Membrane protein TerC, possibly involved in tellurium resistance n=1 Tax=Candidatus Nitrososphaera evergladensis SR1 TaxID=1459636 RepID=A0A075MWN8_9ARCH|nr:TerC family protein [Candidatus Nitrososphaera evergladensis]AIF85538.1 membrane protein TerC, possibly involved in tellurium resistance [Candidatus Nitrososphaera evergladensis SR1]
MLPDGNYYYYILWLVFGLFVGAALAIDLGVISKMRFRRKESTSSSKIPDQENCPVQEEIGTNITFRRALHWTIAWISLAGVFALIIYLGRGYGSLLEFVSAYTLEKSLSVDNMFVFAIIFSSLAIPHKYQHKVLFLGILGAISMRIPLILAGTTLLENFHWMLYVFGGLLLVTALRMALQRREKETIDIKRNVAVRLLRRLVPITSTLREDKFLFRSTRGVLYATPMLVALVVVELTDLIFAMDSIPAVLAITTDPFIVITSNIFAILGLRSLYFLLAGLMDRFYYLKPALIALLVLVGAKMLFSDFYKIPIEASLAAIFAILGSAVGLSIAKTRIGDKNALKNKQQSDKDNKR